MKKKITGIHDTINKEFTKPEFSVQQLADHLGISTTYLRDLAWRQYSMCPYDMIENKRLEKALSLLHDESLNMYEICLQSGYANPHTLRDAFKKRLGEAPADIRLRLHQEGGLMVLQSYLSQLKTNLQKTFNIGMKRSNKLRKTPAKNAFDSRS